MAEDLNSGLSRRNPASKLGRTWTRGLRIASPAHCSRPFALLSISRRSPPGPRCINAQKRLKAEILDSNPKGDDIFLICRVALLTVIVVVVVVVSLITKGIISSKQVNDFVLFCCYQVFQIQVGKPFMTQLHLM